MSAWSSCSAWTRKCDISAHVRHSCCNAGAWSSKLQAWLPQLPDISGLKVHSIVVADPQQRTTADALFLAYRYRVLIDIPECRRSQLCALR